MKVFLKPRWRIMIVFAVLASTFCIVAGTVIDRMFYDRLTDALDQELTALSDELSAFVDLMDQKPDLDPWHRNTKIMPRSFVNVALYTPDGHLLESYGHSPLKEVISNKTELIVNGEMVRVLSRKLESSGRHVGYLQILVSTRARDQAMNELTWLMRLALPVVLLGFIVAGYFFSGWAMKPIELAFAGHKRFMSDASHELKTPLTIAQTHSEALEAELEEQNVKTNRLQIIRNAHNRIHRLIDDLLLLTQTEAQRSTHIVEGVSANQMVTSLVEDFQEKYTTKGIDLRMELATPDIILRCDPEMMRRALTNLIENAWRYTDTGGQVKVTVSALRGEAKLSVQDSGIGIAASALPFLFDRFYRVDASRSSKEGGSGLGLSIVKAIVESNRGRVDVTSSAGAGSTFTLTVPSV